MFFRIFEKNRKFAESFLIKNFGHIGKFGNIAPLPVVFFLAHLNQFLENFEFEVKFVKFVKTWKCIQKFYTFFVKSWENIENEQLFSLVPHIFWMVCEKLYLFFHLWSKIRCFFKISSFMFKIFETIFFNLHKGY